MVQYEQGWCGAAHGRQAIQATNSDDIWLALCRSTGMKQHPTHVKQHAATPQALDFLARCARTTAILAWH